MRNVSDKSCEENPNHILYSKPFSENHTRYEKMWKNIVELGRPKMTI
jgi:hypothetical protein